VKHETHKNDKLKLCISTILHVISKLIPIRNTFLCHIQEKCHATETRSEV